MFVVGRVLDPQGRPVPDATIGVSVRRRMLLAPMGSEENSPAPVGQAKTGPDGRFRLDAPRTSSSRHAEFGVTALAPGYGVAWAGLDPDEDEPAADLTLPPERVIAGRLRDVDGRPAAGVRVSVVAVLRVGPAPPLRTAQGRVIESLEGPYRWWLRINDLPGWPKPATSDAEGQFEIHGIGPDLRVDLSVLDPRFAPQAIQASTEAGARPLRWTLQPARVLNGRVTYGDTGLPVAHAEVLVSATEPGKGTRLTRVEADGEGRFRVSPAPGSHVTVGAMPPEGWPYSRGGKGLDWPPGATEQSIDVALPRGALIHGKVTEEGTGRPVAGATVYFNPHAPRFGRTEGSGWSRTRADGTFAIGVGAHPGHLAIHAPDEDYQLQAVSNSQFYEGEGGGLHVYAHAFVACDPRPGDVEANVALRRGAAVTLRLIGPDGGPVRDVWVYSRAVLAPMSGGIVRTWLGGFHDVARNGHFQVHGLAPDAEVLVCFLQPERKLGATVRLSGRSAASGPIAVRLEPCGQAMARLVGPDGQPVTGQPRGLSLTMAVTPGPPAASAEERAWALAADEAALSRIDPVNHGNPLMADTQGRITLPALIPGATYRIIDRSAVAARDVGEGPLVRREFIVGPGEAVALGDITIANPGGRNRP
jgi:hypothetical protein